MLFDELDKARRRTIMTMIVFVFVGAAFLVVPEAYMPFVGSACAFALVVWSVVAILEFAYGPKVLIRYLGLFVALAAGLLGVALFVFDNLFLRLVTGLVAAIPILGGIVGSYHALVFARRSGRRGWWVPLVLSILLVGFGAMTLFTLVCTLRTRFWAKFAHFFPESVQTWPQGGLEVYKLKAYKLNLYASAARPFPSSGWAVNPLFRV